eukprot:29149_1
MDLSCIDFSSLNVMIGTDIPDDNAAPINLKRKQINELTDHTSLLIIGYVKSVESKDYIIPYEITQLIISFYHKPLIIFLYEPHQSGGIFNIVNLEHTKKSFRIHSLQDISTPNLSAPFCFIPNIKNIIPSNVNIKTNEPFYDALICQQYPDNDMSYLNHGYMGGAKSTVLLLFNSHSVDSMQYYAYQTQYLKDFNESCEQFVFCGDKFGIIGCDTNYLYQLKLQHINNIELYKSYQIGCYSRYLQGKSNKMQSGVQFPHMEYLKSAEKLFTISCNKLIIEHIGFNPSYNKIMVPECDIFDLNTHKWTSLTAYNIQLQTYAKSFLCSTDYYDKSIYMISNCGPISQFDLVKNTWIHYKYTYNKDYYRSCYEPKTYLSSCEFYNYENGNPVLWVSEKNKNVLSCAFLTAKHQVQFRKFDLRDKNLKWIEINDGISRSKLLESSHKGSALFMS